MQNKQYFLKVSIYSVILFVFFNFILSSTSSSSFLENLSLTGFILILMSAGIFLYRITAFDALIYSFKSAELLVKRVAGKLIHSDLSKDRTLYKSTRDRYKDVYLFANHIKDNKVKIYFLFGVILSTPEIIIYLISS